MCDGTGRHGAVGDGHADRDGLRVLFGHAASPGSASACATVQPDLNRVQLALHLLQPAHRLHRHSSGPGPGPLPPAEDSHRHRAGQLHCRTPHRPSLRLPTPRVHLYGLCTESGCGDGWLFGLHYAGIRDGKVWSRAFRNTDRIRVMRPLHRGLNQRNDNPHNLLIHQIDISALVYRQLRRLLRSHRSTSNLLHRQEKGKAKA